MNNIKIEVVYASIHQQHLISVEMPAGSTIAEVIQASGILLLYPEIDLNAQKVGVFGRTKQLDEIVHTGERIEIYRPLTIDPKEARRTRAKARLKGDKNT